MANLTPNEYFKNEGPIRSSRLRFQETASFDDKTLKDIPASVDFVGQNDRVIFLSMNKKGDVRLMTFKILNKEGTTAKPDDVIDSIKNDSDFPGVDITDYVKKILGRKYEDLLTEDPTKADQFIENHVQKSLNVQKAYFVEKIEIIQTPWDTNVVPTQPTGPSTPPVENKTVTTTEPMVATSSVGASASNVGATASILGEFTFNVEQDNTFIGVNNQFGTLYTIGIGEIKEEPLDIPEEGLPEEGLDEEYQEENYSPENEIALELANQRDETERLKNDAENSKLGNNDIIDKSEVGSPIKQKSVKDAIITLMNILIKEGGFTKEQAAGICGNIKAESGFKYWNVEDGCSNIRPKGTSSKRWDSGYANGKNYGSGGFSGIGLAQWTYGRRYKMEAYVGKFLTEKGIKAKTLNGILDTDPGLHKGDTSKIYGGAGDSLEAYLKTIDNLFEAQCSFLQHELKNDYSGIIKIFNGGKPSGNTATLLKNGFFINSTNTNDGKRVAQTVSGYAECVVCNFEVPNPVGKAIKGKSQESYKTLVKERTKNALDCLATYNGK